MITAPQSVNRGPYATRRAPVTRRAVLVRGLPDTDAERDEECRIDEALDKYERSRRSAD